MLQEIEMKYLVDSCIWVDFFSHKKHFKTMSTLLTDNCAFVNEVILAELLPSAKLKNETFFIECLSGIEIIPLNINWKEIGKTQISCIKTGINKVGLLDIVIVQNAKQNNIGIFSNDKHIITLGKLLDVEIKIE